VPDLRALGEDFLTWCAAFGIRLFPWQAQAFGEATRREAGRFVHALAGISVPRGNGKSYAAALVGAWRLVAGPQPQLVLSAALDYEGAKVVLDHAGAIFRRHADLEAAVEIRSDSIITSTGSRWLVRSREHTASRGLHPDVVLFDEAGWSRDAELFASLLASQASVLDPLTLVVSTVGRLKTGPLWTIRELATQELAETGGLR
jgi:phage terminase large subunit-like protein